MGDGQVCRFYGKLMILPLNFEFYQWFSFQLWILSDVIILIYEISTFDISVINFVHQINSIDSINSANLMDLMDFIDFMDSKDNENDWKLKNWNISESQMFFISALNSFCSVILLFLGDSFLIETFWRRIYVIGRYSLMI